MAFIDVKERLDDPEIGRILACALFDASPEGLARKAAAYRAHADWQLYGWTADGGIVGVCGFQAHQDNVEILHIAVVEQARGRGIGRGMVAALWERYGLRIEAETDDDAVDFYRRCGFETAAVSKYGGRRWVCRLREAPRGGLAEEWV